MSVKSINVGMGETKLSGLAGEQLVAPGLGSCIGLSMYEPDKKIAGMVHIVLPDSSISSGDALLPGKYADTAIPDLLGKMLESGAAREKIIVMMAGGAQMFNLEKCSNILNIGMRNVIATKAALSREKLVLRAHNTGGVKGRTVRVEVKTGIFYIRSIGEPEITLDNGL